MAQDWMRSHRLIFQGEGDTATLTQRTYPPLGHPYPTYPRICAPLWKLQASNDQGKRLNDKVAGTIVAYDRLTIATVLGSAEVHLGTISSNGYGDRCRRKQVIASTFESGE